MIPPLMNAERLVALVRRLRGKRGCPWDRRQTHRSIRTNLIEETWETIEAIERDNPAAMREELGDLLMQVVFHAAIEEQKGRFSFSDVVKGVCEKLVRRHPHVFGRRRDMAVDAAYRQWERLKRVEKPGRGGLAGVPRAMPSVLRAVRIQGKASRLGFEWRRAAQAEAKLEEELHELRAAVRSRKRDHIRHELGDVMFALVKLARFLGVNPDDALQAASDRFTRRFHSLEDRLEKTGRKMHETRPEELYRMWRRSR